MPGKEKAPPAPWQEIKQRPVLKSMVGSYLLVLAVPLVLCLLLYWQSSRTIRAENEAMYDSTLKQVSIDMDAYLTEVQQILNRMLLDATFQRAARLSPNDGPEGQLKLIEAVAELTRLHLSHPNIDNVFLVLNQSDQAVSTVAGAMDQQLFFQTYYPSDQFSAQQFQTYMRQPHHQWDMLSLNCSNGKQCLLFTRSFFSQNGGAAAVVAVDLDLLNKRLGQFTWDPQLEFYAVHPNGSVVCHTAADPVLDAVPEPLQPTEGFRQMNSGGQSYRLMVRNSSCSAWKYVLLVSDLLLAQSARQIQLYTFLGLLVCMVVSLILSLRLAHRNYHPLMHLIGYFSSQRDAAPPQLSNEYAQLEAYIQQFFEQRGREQHALWNSQQSLEKYRLYTLLERPGRADLSDTAGGPLPPAPAYMVTLFTIPQERIVFSPKAFYGEKHLIRARLASQEEIAARRNLAFNCYDRHGDNGYFPHSSANVETRGEVVFASYNAIDGMYENGSHGKWPYQSWGINRDPSAALRLDFGRPVKLDELRLTLRADFPHDSYWTAAAVEFSDGSREALSLCKSAAPQSFPISARTVEWLVLKDLVKAEDESPFPALTQLEAWGTEA